MAWIEARQSLRNHPKVTRLCRAMNMSRVEAIGNLMMLWWWCLDYAEDGQLGRFKDDEIAAGAEVYAEQEKFIEALCDCGFIDRKERRIHDWLDYAGLYLTRKYSTSNRKKLALIWKGYGQRYGSNYRREPIANKQRTNSERKVSLPNQPYQPNLTNHTIPTSGAREHMYAIPEPKEKPVEALIMRFKVLKGVPHEHEGWDTKWREYYRPHAEKLLHDTGSYAQAYACLEHYAGVWGKKNFQDWTLRAVAERAVEWKAAQGGKSHGTANSERFFEALRKQRAMAQQGPGLRATTETGAILGALRDHAAAVSRSGAVEKRGAVNGHGRAAGEVQSPGLEGQADRGQEP